jgi:DNA-binding response OmpR family regulator
MLEEAGYEVVTAESPLTANPHIYVDQPPNLILMDVMMPFMSGDTKIGFLREREKSRDIPVVLMSTKPVEELRKIASECGADGYIAKPFQRQDLIAALEHHL